MNDVLFSTYFGSCLYGTETKDSDTDWYVVTLPTKEEILLGNTTTQVTKDLADLRDNGTDLLCVDVAKYISNAFAGNYAAAEVMFSRNADKIKFCPIEAIINTVYTEHKDLILKPLADNYLSYLKSNLSAILANYHGKYMYHMCRTYIKLKLILDNELTFSLPKDARHILTGIKTSEITKLPYTLDEFVDFVTQHTNTWKLSKAEYSLLQHLTKDTICKVHQYIMDKK